MSRGKRIQSHNCKYLNYLLVCEVGRQPLFKNVTDQIRRFRLPPRGGVAGYMPGDSRQPYSRSKCRRPCSRFCKTPPSASILGRSAADTKRLEPFVRSSGGGRHEDRPILRVELSGNDARMLVLHSDKLSPCIHSPIGRKEDLVRLSGSPARVGPTTPKQFGAKHQTCPQLAVHVRPDSSLAVQAAEMGAAIRCSRVGDFP